MHRFDVQLACPSNTIAETPEAALVALQRRGFQFEIRWRQE